jgi:hypothetical protein
MKKHLKVVSGSIDDFFSNYTLPQGYDEEKKRRGVTHKCITFWLPSEVYDQFTELQTRSKKEFKNDLVRVLTLAIEQAAKQL